MTEREVPELPLEMVELILGLYMAQQGEEGPFTRFLKVRALCHSRFEALHNKPVVLLENISFQSFTATTDHPERYAAIAATSHWLFLPNCLADPLTPMSELVVCAHQHQHIHCTKKALNEKALLSGNLSISLYESVSSRAFFPDEKCKATLLKHMARLSNETKNHFRKSNFRSRSELFIRELPMTELVNDPRLNYCRKKKE